MCGLCRCQPNLRSASSRSPPSLRTGSRLLQMVMTTKMQLSLTSFPSQLQLLLSEGYYAEGHLHCVVNCSCFRTNVVLAFGVMSPTICSCLFTNPCQYISLLRCCKHSRTASTHSLHLQHFDPRKPMGVCPTHHLMTCLAACQTRQKQS